MIFLGVEPSPMNWGAKHEFIDYGNEREWELKNSTTGWFTY